MKSFKKLLCAGLTLAVMSSAMAFAGCTGKTAEEPQKELTYQEATYQKYRAYAEAMGDEVLTYEEWLESIRGEDGKDGKDGTSWLVGLDEPLETLGKNGDFYLNTSNFDLYLKSNNAWSRIGNIKGDDGKDGADGTKWFTGVEANPADDEAAAQAKDGDFYFNTDIFEMWQKVEGVWLSLGTLGAAQKTNGIPVTIEQDQTATVPLVGVEQGWNYVYADLGDATLSDGANLQAYISDGIHSEFCLSNVNSENGKNVYFGFVNVTDGASELTLAAANQSVSANITFKKYEQVTIESGVPFELAMFPNNTPSENLITAKFGTGFISKYIAAFNSKTDFEYKLLIENFGNCTSLGVTFDNMEAGNNGNKDMFGYRNKDFSTEQTITIDIINSCQIKADSIYYLYKKSPAITNKLIPVVVTMTFD